MAFLNFAAIYVVTEMSATTMVVMDSARTMIVWAVSMALSWQEFQYLQLIGFILLCLGMSIYNDIFVNQCKSK